MHDWRRVVTAFAAATLMGAASPDALAQEVRLFYGWLSDHPSTLRTLLHGERPMAEHALQPLHRSIVGTSFEVAWRGDASHRCAEPLDTALLDRAAKAIASTADRVAVRDALRHRPVVLEVIFVPRGRAFEFRAPIFSRSREYARLAFGTRLSCDAPEDAVESAVGIATHELRHMEMRSRRLPRLDEEAIAYTDQMCAVLGFSGRLRPALQLVNTMPPILFELFSNESPLAFVKGRLRNERSTSLRAGLLAQLNVAAFLGLDPIAAGDHERAGMLRGYCRCVDASTPAFLATKPGELWRDSNGATCGVSAPATAPRNGR